MTQRDGPRCLLTFGFGFGLAAWCLAALCLLNPVAGGIALLVVVVVLEVYAHRIGAWKARGYTPQTSDRTPKPPQGGTGAVRP